jgi:hypothetical protein
MGGENFKCYPALHAHGGSGYRRTALVGRRHVSAILAGGVRNKANCKAPSIKRADDCQRVSECFHALRPPGAHFECQI